MEERGMRSIHEFDENATKNVAACAGNTGATGRFDLKNAGLVLLARPLALGRGVGVNGRSRASGIGWKVHLAFFAFTLTFFGVGSDALAQTDQVQKGKPSVVKDFAGRPIPPLAHELIDLARPPEIPGKKPAALPGWIYKDGTDRAGNEFQGHPVATLSAANLHIEALYKNGQRAGVIRKIHPDRSWQIMDVFFYSKFERMTESCDSNGHVVPEDHLLVGIMRKGDPRRPPVPPRPTEIEQGQYFKDNFGRHMPRSCVGDTQIARIAATLNLITGKLALYSAKPVICISPFFDPCAPDPVAEAYGN
jgi:hypothetical protein